jgi:hypothetical protein
MVVLSQQPVSCKERPFGANGIAIHFNFSFQNIWLRNRQVFKGSKFNTDALG